jgi:AraC-like DNA-binding protein
LGFTLAHNTDLNGLDRRVLAPAGGRSFGHRVASLFGVAARRDALGPELARPVRSEVDSHGRVVVDDVARSLGISKRTLARKLLDEGLNFTEVLQQLRRDLAHRYLDDPKLHISKIGWLLGFNEVSAFTHTFKRWTGKTPSQMRTTAAF